MPLLLSARVTVSRSGVIMLAYTHSLNLSLSRAATPSLSRCCLCISPSPSLSLPSFALSLFPPHHTNFLHVCIFIMRRFAHHCLYAQQTYLRAHTHTPTHEFSEHVVLQMRVYIAPHTCEREPDTDRLVHDGGVVVSLCPTPFFSFTLWEAKASSSIDRTAMLTLFARVLDLVSFVILSNPFSCFAFQDLAFFKFSGRDFAQLCACAPV